MRSKGMPFRFSEKRVVPFAIVCGLPANWKKASATAGSKSEEEFSELRVVSKFSPPEQALDYAQGPKPEGGNEGTKRTYCILPPAFARGRPPLSASGAPRAAPRRCAEGRRRARSPPRR